MLYQSEHNLCEMPVLQGFKGAFDQIQDANCSLYTEIYDPYIFNDQTGYGNNLTHTGEAQEWLTHTNQIASQVLWILQLCSKLDGEVRTNR